MLHQQMRLGQQRVQTCGECGGSDLDGSFPACPAHSMQNWPYNHMISTPDIHQALAHGAGRARHCVCCVALGWREVAGAWMVSSWLAECLRFGYFNEVFKILQAYGRPV